MADLNTGITGQEMKDAVLRAHNLKSITYTGLVVSVPDTQVKGFFASAQTLSLLPNATWYVGFDQFSKELIALPRLGHTGWIPVAKCVCDATTITELTPIDPVLPVCRIPRTVAKIETGEQLNVLVLGSSLAEGTGPNVWPTIVFGTTASDYKLGDSISFDNYALGGSPNQYQLAQTGIISGHTSRDYPNNGYPLPIGNKKPPNSRADFFNNFDLIVLTCLANGGFYRIEAIEPIIRNLRKLGKEIIVTSDHAYNGTGSDLVSMADIEVADMYVDSESVRRVAENYGAEYADTGAYVADATLRHGYNLIYQDNIHMQNTPATSATGVPGGGHEVWGRAIRSVIPFNINSPTAIKGIEFESRELPPPKIVTDLKAPGDAFIMLPKDEVFVSLSAASAGTLMDSPVTTRSFAARAYLPTLANERVVEVGVDKKVAIVGQGVVAFAIVYVTEPGLSCTFDVFLNNAFVKTMSVTSTTFIREKYISILSNDELNKADSDPDNDVCNIKVTAGSIKIGALICQTFDQDYIAPEEMKLSGTWTNKVLGGGANMPGYATDTQGDYAALRCPETGRRVAWLISARPDSKPINTWSGVSQSLNTVTTGNANVRPYGNHIGPGQYHYIECNETLTPAGSATNGYGLHIGGAIIVNDR